jgi:hypothetical protein
VKRRSIDLIENSAVRQQAMWVAALLLLVAVMVRVPDDTWRSMFEPFGRGVATDVRLRWREVQAWFSGNPVYGVIESADYPPGAYPILWSLAGWSSLATTRVVWAVATVALLGVTMACVAAATRGRTRAERTFMILVAPALYATSATILVGQTGLIALAGILAAGLLSTRPRTWRRDVAIALLISVALMKPTFTAPFFWFILFVCGLRAATLTVVGFGLLTALGSAYQGGDVVGLMRGWLAQGTKVEYLTAHGNLHSWLGGAGLEAYILPASLLTLGIAGAWSWRWRATAWWLQLGVLSVVARVWSYHRWYDDILLLFPALALFQVVTSVEASRRARWLSLVLLALIVGCGIAPARLLQVSETFKTVKTLTWLLAGAFLIWQARAQMEMIRLAAPDAAARSRWATA